MFFRNRHDAGKQLVKALEFLRGRSDVIVLAIPRGGVVIGYEIARALDIPLDVWVARKIGAPMNPELALGAVTGTGVIILEEQIIRSLNVSQYYLDERIREYSVEIEKLTKRYRGERPPITLKDKIVLLVDDGIATGSTVIAGLKAIHKMQPAQCILAVPVAPEDTVRRLKKEVDQLIVLEVPKTFSALSRFYSRFDQTTDNEVISLVQEIAVRQ